ncbi:MAG TPA: hypothetical protein VIH85_09285 [Solirubrobacteraceae bacterium]
MDAVAGGQRDPLSDTGTHQLGIYGVVAIGGNQQPTADRAAGAGRLPLRLRE